METMTNTPLPVLPARVADQRHFGASGRVEHGRHVVRVSGELDLAGRETVIQSCTRAERPLDVVVDMAELTFLDCAGYSALSSARSSLLQRGGTLTLINGVGEPARLLALIDRIDVGVTDGCAQNVVS